MTDAEPWEPVLIPRIEDTVVALEVHTLRQDLETLSEAAAQWVLAIRDFIGQVEGSNFTDRNGHALEMNVAYRALKDSVSE